MSEVKKPRQTKKIKNLSNLEHARTTTMWSGSRSRQVEDMYYYDSKTNKFIYDEQTFTPALYKIVDESAVNAVDQHVKNVNNPKSQQTTEIKASLNRKTGEFSFYNNGPGFEIIDAKTADGRTMCAVQMAYTVFLAGENFNDKANSVSGGVNGVGATLTAAYSTRFHVETYDETTGQLYTQTYLNGLTKIKPAKITEKDGKGFTKITFLPDYAFMDYEGGYNEKRDYRTLHTLLHTRCMEINAFVSNKCKVYLDGKMMPDNADRFLSFTELFNNESKLAHTKLQSTMKKYKPYPWEVVVTASPNGKESQYSIVCGVVIPNGGTHIRHIQKLLVKGMTPNMLKLLKEYGVEVGKKLKKSQENLIINNLRIFVKAQIPGEIFVAQVKDRVGCKISQFKSYTLKQSFIDQAWDIIKKAVANKMTKKRTRVKKKKYINKYTPAKKAKRYSDKATLFVCEGDSAMTLVDYALCNTKKSGMSYEHFGIFSLGGNPSNPRKMRVKVKGALTKLKTQMWRLPDRFFNSITDRFVALLQALNINVDCEYRFEKDLQKLLYSRVIVAVDEDLHGMKIWGLFVNFIHLIAPNLIHKWGFIKRMRTPIIRAFNKGAGLSKEFYTHGEFDEWVKKVFKNDMKRVLFKFTPKYYKGLATHETECKIPMFLKMEENLIHLNSGGLKTMNAWLEKYYASDTAARKSILSTPVNTEFKDVLNPTVPEILNINVKEHMLEDIYENLPCIMDGLNPCKNNVLTGAAKVFAARTKEMKLCEISASAAKITHYPHGTASLEQTATLMGQIFPCAKNLPLLIPFGGFGSRKKGGTDAGAPRYIEAALNKKLFNAMLNKLDLEITPQLYREAQHIGPKWYPFNIPYVLLENIKNIGSGWRCNTFARDFTEVTDELRSLIKGEQKNSGPMTFWKNQWTGDLRDEYNRKDQLVRTWSVGKYNYDKKKGILTITELPIGTCSDKYVGDMARIKSTAAGSCDGYKQGVWSILPFTTKEGEANIFETLIDTTISLEEAVSDNTNDDVGGVEIVIKMDKKAVDEHVRAFKADPAIGENPLFDFWEITFKLKSSLKKNLNVILDDGSVFESNNYSEILDMWFVARKELYIQRIQRQIIIIELKIIRLKEMNKFSDLYDDLEIDRKTTMKAVDKKLTDAKMLPMDSTLLMSPGYIKNDEIEDLVLRGDTSFTYLINMRIRDMSEEGNKSRLAKIKALTAELKNVKKDNLTSGSKFPGQKAWLSELDNLVKVVKAGTASDWNFGKKKPRF
jgi:DNA gyrase/topoisomerase IV subunit B